MGKHSKPTVNRPNKMRTFFTAILAVGFIASLFGVYAVANDSATPTTQQVIGRTGTCAVDNTSSCVITHGLGVKPTSVVVTPGGPGQQATADITKISDTTVTVKFLWRDGSAFKLGTNIKYNIVYTYVGDAVTPPPTSETPTSPPVSTPPASTPPVSTPPTTPTSTPTQTTTPSGTTCSPTNTIAHFTGEGSDSIGDAPSTEHAGQYNASAEQWAVQNDYRSNMCVYSKDNWYVEIKATDHGDGAVQAYPSMRKIYHDWGGPEDFNLDPKLSTFPQLKVAVAHTSPSTCVGCVYEEAFDIWLNGIGDGPAQTELMIWTHNQGQSPYGTKKASNVTVDGRQWDVYYGSPDYVAYVPAGGASITSGTFDIKLFAADMKARGILRTQPDDPHVGQISYGVEPVDTKGVFKRWDFTNFTVTDK